ncbi:uncharacterized protein LOC120269399 [Dioscorea cayenensis subsp. rotundata]|uniref:Uncharacterized protein LOC120269399 n=1 Tax=Dioscorea cayennensis subsp. rotundata TaxID=55577 RepID=A0AB40BZ04_DIOCR|nr:uncharacterized protein LOC120269399 [Dioscorea cayenensis subsp. rotundata]
MSFFFDIFPFEARLLLCMHLTIGFLQCKLSTFLLKLMKYISYYLVLLGHSEHRPTIFQQKLNEVSTTRTHLKKVLFVITYLQTLPPFFPTTKLPSLPPQSMASGRALLLVALLAIVLLTSKVSSDTPAPTAGGDAQQDTDPAIPVAADKPGERRRCS